MHSVLSPHMRHLFLAGVVASSYVLGGCSAFLPGPAAPPQTQGAVEGACSPEEKTCSENARGANGDEARTARNGGTTPTGADEDEASGDEGIDDDADAPDATEPGQRRAHLLDGWTKEQIEQTVLKDPKSLGSMSIGAPNGGALFNGVAMAEGEAWTLIDPVHAWGTQETTDALVRCIQRVRARFPDTARLYVGHLSGPKGGPLSPHRSHQSGRDVDVGYYYQGDTAWYTWATAANLDRARTWAFVRALITDADVEYIFMDRSIQTMLRQYADSIGEPKAWVDGLFDGAAGLRPIVQHAKGHATHIHIRFYNPTAQETGRRLYALLVQRHLVIPAPTYVRYVAKKGDTLVRIAKQFGTTTKAIQDTNRMRSTLIRAGAAYRIARRGGIAVSSAPTLIPPRRMPPTTAPSPAPLPNTGSASAVAASSTLARPVSVSRPPSVTSASPTTASQAASPPGPTPQPTGSPSPTPRPAPTLGPTAPTAASPGPTAPTAASPGPTAPTAASPGPTAPTAASPGPTSQPPVPRMAGAAPSSRATVPTGSTRSAPPP